MNKENYINMVFKRSQEYFYSDITKSSSYRIEQLKNLKASIEKNEKYIYAALKEDLNKSYYETFMSELSLVYKEINYAIRNLKDWMKPEKVKTEISQFPGCMKTYKDPYGVVLIISPWNYPFQLTMVPLIGAIAAGNCAVIKPSNYSSATSRLIMMLIHSALPRGLATVIEGGRDENKYLLEQKFDYIFFTGSPKVGKIVMEKASKNLIPVTLELGGKSPVIITETANIKKAAKRVVFGKLLNAGQTCIAPDYILVHKSVKNELIRELINELDNSFKSKNYYRNKYPKMINKEHFLRIISYLQTGNTIYGGKINIDTLQIEPTIVYEPSLDSKLMQEEIFGPILPIIAYENLDVLIEKLKRKPKSLALYLFTKDEEEKEKIIKNLSFGGGCINDTVLQISSIYGGFGGVGNSGMGRYHGKYSFDTFSHEKTILEKSWLADNPLKYHPYNLVKFGIIKKVLN